METNLVVSGLKLKRRIELLYPGRGGEQRRGAGGARDERTRGNSNRGSVQVVSEVPQAGDKGR